MFEVKKEILDSHEVLLEVVFEPEAVEEAKRDAAREISNEVNIPGFRKGKAPYNKVVQYVGEPAVAQEAAEHLLHDYYSEFLEEADISPYGPGDFVDMSTSPLTFKIRVPLEPTVDLGDYRDLREAWTDPTVSDEEMEQVLAQVREEHAVLEPIEGPAELGNELRITVIGTVEGDEVVHEHEIPVVLSEERPFLSPEFVQALLGVTVGEERTFTITLPEDLDEPTLQGQEAEFSVEVEHVYERNLPDLDDALASTAGSFETFDELVEDIRNRIVTEKRQQAGQDYYLQLLHQLVDQAEINYPPQFVDDTLGDMVTSIGERMKRQQKMSLEDALQLQGRTMEQFRQDLRPQAESRAKEILVLRELAKEEEISASDDDVLQEYRRFLTQIGMVEAPANMSLNMGDPLAEQLRGTAFERKLRERLIAIGRGEADRDEAEAVVMPVEAEADTDDQAEEQAAASEDTADDVANDTTDSDQETE